MKNLSQVLWGLLIALVSLGLLFGGLSLSLAENNVRTPPATTLPPALSATFTASATATPLPVASTTEMSPTPTLTLTPTIPPPPTNCPPPAGWVVYNVKTGDTLAVLSTRYRTTSASLKQANCLETADLVPGTVIYVPPSPTQTRIPCGPPTGWVLTFVQPGDTLFRLSQAYGITVTQLQNANCMGNSTLLRVGQTLHVPPWATRVPSPTLPGIENPTFVPTDTFNPVPTDTPPAFFTGTSIIPTDTP